MDSLLNGHDLKRIILKYNLLPCFENPKIKCETRTPSFFLHWHHSPTDTLLDRSPPPQSHWWSVPNDISNFPLQYRSYTPSSGQHLCIKNQVWEAQYVHFSSYLAFYQCPTAHYYLYKLILMGNYVKVNMSRTLCSNYNWSKRQ